MYSITKRFGPYPFAHRQWTHTGHCRFIHGHNFYFELTICARSHEDLDEHGFVIDFGNFKAFKEILDSYFDHTLVLALDDPRRTEIEQFHYANDLGPVISVRSPSAEGLAEFVAYLFRDWLAKYPWHGSATRNIWLASVTVYEDEKNSATFAGSFDLARGKYHLEAQ